MLLHTYQIQHIKQFARAVHFSSALNFFKMECTVEKRARMLAKLIKNNDKKQNWHLQVGSTGAPDQNIYDKVHRPHRRASVLNSLFMKNITDVLSTGDVCPEIIGYGVEITGVRVTSDYQIVNVYWQIPDVEETCNVNVDVILAESAPDIRGELIRRNVLGKVPRIYFIRDPTNKRAADFQRCLEISGVSEIKDPPSLPAEDFLKNLYKFSDARGENPKKNAVEEPKKVEAKVVVPVPMPERPHDMRFDVMGLNHEKIMNQVLSAKRNVQEIPQASSSVVDHIAEEGGEFKNRNVVYSIPAVPLRDDADREKVMKRFCIDRKAQWAKMSKYNREEIESSYNTMPDDVTSEIIDDVSYEEDYFDEEYEDTDDRCA